MTRDRASSFLALVAVAGLISLVPGAAMSGEIPRLGYLLARGPDPEVDNAFFQGLRDLGYVEGKNIVIVRRYADNDFTRLPEHAADLVRQRVDVIVAAPYPAVQVAKQATTRIPIVMLSGGDPVAMGLVTSLSRPGGNVTGVSNQGDDAIPKMIELLRELIPTAKRIAVLVNPRNRIHDNYRQVVQDTLRTLHLQPVFVEAAGAEEFPLAFLEAVRSNADGLIIPQDPIFFNNRQQLVKLSLSHRLPTMAPFREFAESGGLVSYGRNLSQGFRRLATYVDRILKGADPGDLPIEQPLRFELVVNGRIAKELGIPLPKSIVQRADQIIL